jgi:hypothetical protein
MIVLIRASNFRFVTYNDLNACILVWFEESGYGSRYTDYGRLCIPVKGKIFFSSTKASRPAVGSIQVLFNGHLRSFPGGRAAGA